MRKWGSRDTLGGMYVVTAVPRGAYQSLRCDWLGHESYRCGACKKDYVKVKDEKEYDNRCPHCNATIHVSVDPLDIF